jgi:short-subunit dehydrogenase
MMKSAQTIVITGASAGIGKALAVSYAKKGVTLGLIARNQDKLAIVAELCQQQGASVEVGIIDVTDDELLKQWLIEFDKRHPVDLLIANAGVTSSIVNGEVESWQQVKQMMQINFCGVINSIYPLITPMQQRKRGQIAIMSSVAAYCGMPISPTYCATKAAIKSYGESLRGWLQADGIAVSVICPGFVKTELSAQFRAPKLFMISADKAADAIQQGLAKNKALISFPFLLDMGMRFLAVLPTDFANYLLILLGYGARKKIKSQKSSAA